MSSRPAPTVDTARGPPPARSSPATASRAQRPPAPTRSAPGTAPPAPARTAQSAPTNTTTTATPPAPAAPTETLPPPSARVPAATSPPPPTAAGPESPPQTQTSSPPAGPVPPPIPPPPIFTDTVNELIIISDGDTYNKLLTDVGRKHLLVEFYAPWCGACMLINRKLEELATTYNGKLIIAKVNIEDCEQIAIDNDVSMMPSFMLLKEKQVLEKFAGSNEEKLISTIKKHVGEPTNGVEVTNEI